MHPLAPPLVAPAPPHRTGPSAGCPGPPSESVLAITARPSGRRPTWQNIFSTAIEPPAAGSGSGGGGTTQTHNTVG